MALWKKKVNGWPPNDLERERKLYNDSLILYKNSIDQLKLNYNGINEAIKNKTSDFKVIPYTGVFANDAHYDNKALSNSINPISTLGIRTLNIIPDDPKYYPWINIYKKPTGNALKQAKLKNNSTKNNDGVVTKGNGTTIKGIETIPQLSKVPIIQPETQTSYIKFRPPTTLPEGNVELQNTGYTTIGIKKKPDGTRFIYDRSGKTDKTVIIDDNRIGFEHYIKKLYE